MKRLAQHQLLIEEIHEKCMDAINDKLMDMQDQTEGVLRDAIDRSGMDISECGHCGKLVVCIPDGLPICEPCAEVETKRQNPTRGGFTLVELMIIICILVIVAGLCVRHFSPSPEKVEPTPEQVEAQQWQNIGTIATRSELVVLPTGERVLILFRRGHVEHSMAAVLLPPLPVVEVER